MDNNVPNMAQLGQYNVTLPGYEAITQTLYDFQAYPALGQTSLTFFAVPVGQSGKTLEDTNMTLAGQLPANQQFLITSVEVLFFPTTPTVAAGMPAVYGADAVAAQVNDAYIVARSGYLRMIIGSKDYLVESPLGRLPGKTQFDITAAAVAGTTTGTATQSRIAYGKSSGRPYALRAPLRLTENMNFSVSLNWATAQAIANPGRIGVVLDGILYRKAQ